MRKYQLKLPRFGPLSYSTETYGGRTCRSPLSRWLIYTRSLGAYIYVTVKSIDNGRFLAVGGGVMRDLYVQCERNMMNQNEK
jgi:hypothetical protein